MNVIVTGASGLLGADIARSFARAGHAVTALLGRRVLDLTAAAEMAEFVDNAAPDLIVHSAGFRMVDAAERDPESTYAVNVLGTRNVALACQKHGIPMMHISSDSVFDGETQRPYCEYDRPHPVNVYGYSKLIAEQEVRTHCRRHFIVRVPLLFGALGHPESNYILRMADRLRRGERIEYTTDQLCSPTGTRDVGDVLVEMASSGFYGLYHVANTGSATRFGFYRRCAELLGLDTSLLVPITQQDKPARRPKNTLFSSVAFRKTYPQLVLGEWEPALERCVGELKAQMA